MSSSSHPPAASSTGSFSELERRVRELVTRAVDGALGDVPSDGAALATGAGTTSTDTTRTDKKGTDEKATGAEGTIALGADHGGFALKERLADLLRQEGWTVTDCGTFSDASCDYPDFAHEVARRVADGHCRWGVVVDGAGIGSSMVANKVPGVRAALCYDLSSAKNSREHNHANVLTLGSGLVGPNLAEQILRTWLETPWGEGRHARRTEKITAVERRYAISGAGVGTRP